MKRFAILGGGNMGRALIGGLLRRGVQPEQIAVGERIRAARASRWLKDFGIEATADNADAVATANFVVVAVKPQDAGTAAAAAGASLLQQQSRARAVLRGGHPDQRAAGVVRRWHLRRARHAQSAGAGRRRRHGLYSPRRRQRGRSNAGRRTCMAARGRRRLGQARKTRWMSSPRSPAPARPISSCWRK